MKFILLSAILMASLCLQAQETKTVSGYIKDGSNGETLIGATVLIKELGTGNISNVYGFYSITVPEGDYTIEFSYVGFETTEQEISLQQNVRLDIELGTDSQELEAVVVSAEKEDANITSVEMSTAVLDVKSITKLPAFAGEVDIIKSIQLLPGVSTVGEGASGFNVRGGGVGQNLVLLDEAPVYQTSHMFGFFSVFNPDAVKDIKLYKGGIPAKYGGRLSSILDIRMKEGNSKEFDIAGGIGTVFSRLSVEGPMIKDKASFIVAGRRSYIDILARPFTDVLSEGGAGLYFYDLTAKANYNINEKNRVYVSGYFGRDVFKFDARQGFNWGNRTTTVRWNHLFSDKFFSNFTAFYSNYDYAFAFGENDRDKFEWSSNIITYDFKPEFAYFLNPSNELTFGAEALLYQFKPANAVGVSDGETTDISLDEKYALEISAYFGNDQKVTSNLTAQYGLRLSTFNYFGGTKYSYDTAVPGERRDVLSTEEFDKWESIENFMNLEPRLSLNYQLNPVSSVKASYNRMYQYIHLISNTVAATPIDVWQPSTNNLRPQEGNQVATGYFRNFKNNTYETSVETYYKWNANQVDYVDGADVLINEFLEGELLSGKGRAYGLEVYIKKNKGKFTGWTSYTLGKSELLVDGINYGSDLVNRKGSWYPTRYDQRHNLKITTNYQLTERLNVSGVFTYLTGTPTTFPTDRFYIQGMVIPLNDNARNNIRIPDYHRLDLSLTIENLRKKKPNRKVEDSLVISLYNVYAKENPFSIYFSQGQERVPTDTPVDTFAKQVAILGTIVPAVSYNFKF